LANSTGRPSPSSSHVAPAHTPYAPAARPETQFEQQAGERVVPPDRGAQLV
jgi:hypothetical protein